MRVRDHVVFGTIGAALMRPQAGRAAVGVWAGSVLIDADHYAWFCLRQRHLSLPDAVRYFNSGHAAQHRSTRVLHSPLALFAVVVLGICQRGLRPVALGMTMHVGLDLAHQVAMARARAAALVRDDLRCRRCGTAAAGVQAHVWRQPWLLPSYADRNLISLCAGCHELAHERGGGPGAWTPT